MSRFFNKDMNIQSCTQTEAEPASGHRLSRQSLQDELICLNAALGFVMRK